MIKYLPKDRKTPKNIIGFGKKVTGKEIKDWIWFHQENLTPHTKLAKGMNKYFNLIDELMYKVTIDPNSDFKMVPQIERA